MEDVTAAMRKHQRNSESKEDLIQRLENEYDSQIFVFKKVQTSVVQNFLIFNLSELESKTDDLNILFDKIFYFFSDVEIICHFLV